MTRKYNFIFSVSICGVRVCVGRVGEPPSSISDSDQTIKNVSLATQRSAAKCSRTRMGRTHPKQCDAMPRYVNLIHYLCVN